MRSRLVGSADLVLDFWFLVVLLLSFSLLGMSVLFTFIVWCWGIWIKFGSIYL